MNVELRDDAWYLFLQSGEKKKKKGPTAGEKLHSSFFVPKKMIYINIIIIKVYGKF